MCRVFFGTDRAPSGPKVAGRGCFAEIDRQFRGRDPNPCLMGPVSWPVSVFGFGEAKRNESMEHSPPPDASRLSGGGGGTNMKMCFAFSGFLFGPVGAPGGPSGVLGPGGTRSIAYRQMPGSGNACCCNFAFLWNGLIGPDGATSTP